ncbi:TauD/TfdA family dioxygenase [Nocardia carnea]|uniref:TauD/TfdA family dioxygenase n=1 Tax=Nocardia carnea TaxID=37328 RepID=UPI002455CDA0|nr:TauD/TfdA family dioxygenase [Nocardia carnea]
MNMYEAADSAHRFAAEGARIDELAWTRNDALKTRTWNVGVGPEVLKEFAGYLGSVGDPEGLIDTVEADDLDLPELADLADRLRKQIFGRFGFAHMTGLEAGGFDESELRLFYVLVCLHLGDMLTAYGRLHDVADRGYDFRSTDVSVSKTRVAAPFHTDSTSKGLFPNVFGLLCVRPAMEGGQSLLTSGCRAYQQIAETTPEHLPALFKDHYRNTVTPGDENTDIADNAYPIFTWDVFTEGPTLRYMRHWIETGYAKAGVAISAEDAAAFDRLDEVLEDEANVLSVDMAAGEAIFFNNATVAHNRTEFYDYREAGRKRLLARAWLDVVPTARRS